MKLTFLLAILASLLPATIALCHCGMVSTTDVADANTMIKHDNECHALDRKGKDPQLDSVEQCFVQYYSSDDCSGDGLAIDTTIWGPRGGSASLADVGDLAKFGSYRASLSGVRAHARDVFARACP